MTECTAIAAPTPTATLTPTPTPSTWGWVAYAVDDCYDNDITCSAGATPDATHCDAGAAGTTAVCWDGATYQNPDGCESCGCPTAWCQYKTTLASQCTGGSRTGYVFICAPIASPTPTRTSSETPTPSPCVGDCDSGNSVTVTNIITMVDIALGTAQLSDCTAGDANHDGQITIDEILMAVNNALNGCPGQ